MPFQYTGIGGNENSFLTKEDCIAKCPGNRKIPLSIFNFQLFYSEYLNPCYTGEPFRDVLTNLVRHCSISGNGNGNGNECPVNYFCHMGANVQSTVCCPGARVLGEFLCWVYGIQDPCTSPLAVGSGSASLFRWYFHKQGRRCQQFIYTGTGGNSNNFISRELCQRACPGRSKCF